MTRAGRTSKSGLYLKAFMGIAKEYDNPERTRQQLKQIVYYGVMSITYNNHKATTYKQAETGFTLVSTMEALIGQLTPEEFINTFPVAKEYRGHKYGMKDYFSTMNYINKLEPGKPIGDNALDLIWNFSNRDICIFSVQGMEYLSALRQHKGEPSLAQEWANMNGIETHTISTDHKGNRFIIKNGKTIKLVKRKERARHLKLIK